MSNERAVAVVTGGSMMTDTARFEHAQRVANVFANSQLVPSHLRGKVADCVIAMNIAERLGEDPLTVMQSIYIVGGKAGWSSSYMIARINKSGLIKGRITWGVKGAGKDLEVTAKATLADTGEVVTATASFQMAIAEDWIKNKKYSSMPEQMLRFRSAAMLQRLYFPEVMLGYRTIEEIETEPTATGPVDITPAKTTRSALDQFAADPAPAEVVEVVDADGVMDAAPAPVAAPEPSQSPVEPAKPLDENAEEKLRHALEVLPKLATIEEIRGARQSLKAELGPDQFAVWNAEAYSREKQLQTRR